MLVGFIFYVLHLTLYTFFLSLPPPLVLNHPRWLGEEGGGGKIFLIPNIRLPQPSKAILYMLGQQSGRINAADARLAPTFTTIAKQYRK